VLSLSIAINTTAFSVLNAVLLKPLPYGETERLVELSWQDKRGGAEFGLGHEGFALLKSDSTVFRQVAAYSSRVVFLTMPDGSAEVAVISVSANLFTALGAKPVLGRGFLPSEEKPGEDRVVVLGDAFWHEHWGADTNVIGQHLELDGQNHTVVGIMPPGFTFPFRHPTPFWVPLVPPVGGRGEASVIARLKPGVTLKKARAAMGILADRIEQANIARHTGGTVTVRPLLDRFFQKHRLSLWLLMGTAACVLLIACSNVANLFLIRAAGRQQEMAVRVALGASRGHLMRQMLTESYTLSGTAGIFGLFLSYCAVRLLVSICPAKVPRLAEASLGLPEIVFTVCLMVVVGLVFGMAPLWRMNVASPAEFLNQGRMRSGTGARGWGWCDNLVASQIGLALTSLMGAFLLIYSLMALQRVDLGVQPKSVLVLEVDLPKARYSEPSQAWAFYEPLLHRIRSLPGVRAAGLSSHGLLLNRNGEYEEVMIDGKVPGEPGEAHLVKMQAVSTGFFESLGFRIRRGRVFTAPDTSSSERNVVIDENLARRYFGDTDPLGHRINGRPIIGVVGSARDFLDLDSVQTTCYTPLSDGCSRAAAVVVKTDGEPLQIVKSLRAELAAMDKDQERAKIESLENILAQMLAPQRFNTLLLAVFAGVALLFAGVGIYGLLRYVVAQRTQEIGVRMAVGATRAEVMCLVLRQGGALVLLGTLMGILGSLATTHLLRSLLHEVQPADPGVLALVVTTVWVVSLAACYFPARRAAKVDPMVALKCE
ncbi:MAG TPA: ABC transporter permease, partial [Terriglobia bacterium]|nr:ABC transporter permease [Terriglobia bacterium]